MKDLHYGKQPVPACQARPAWCIEALKQGGCVMGPKSKGRLKCTGVSASGTPMVSAEVS